MKTQRHFAILLVVAFALAARPILAQFTSGSDGSDGALNVTVDTTLPLPPDGIFNFTTIDVAQDAILSFTRNALNTPVYLLATSNVTVEGTIDVSGNPATGNFRVPGQGGPGGFDGGAAGFDDDDLPPGAGLGPGGGLPGPNTTSGAATVGSGSYGARANFLGSTNHGVTYGSPLLIPLIGGSGAGGTEGNPGIAGAGGGGAVLIASDTRITINAPGQITAAGGANPALRNHGSGGAIRLVAPVIEGDGTLNVSSVANGSGRIRTDSPDRSGMAFATLPNPAPISGGAFMLIFPDPNPRLDILEAAGTAIAEGAPNPVDVILPFGSDTNQTVVVQGRDFAGVVPIDVVLTPENGLPRTFPAQIDMTAGNPAQTTVNVTFPINTRTVVHAWTR